MAHVWMRHSETGGLAEFPEESLESGFWQARGWQPCEAPADPDPRQDPRYVDLPAGEAKTPESEPVNNAEAASAVKARKNAASAVTEER